MALNPALKAYEDQVDALITKLSGDIDTFETNYQALVTELKAANTLIQTLQNAPGTLSAEDTTALATGAAALQAAVDKIDALVVPTVPPTPAATP